MKLFIGDVFLCKQLLENSLYFYCIWWVDRMIEGMIIISVKKLS